MQTKTVKERAGEFLSDSKVKIVGLAGSVGLLVASVSADVDIIGLVVALVPAIIIMAIVGFIVAFLDKILAMLTLK
jgi:hypothetical protein